MRTPSAQTPGVRAHGRSRSSAARLLAFLVVSLGSSILFGSGIADGAVIHPFDPVLSGALDRGVASSLAAEAAPVKGTLGLITGFAAGGGGLWVADRVEGGVSRVDRFDGSGDFTGPQLNEQGGFGALELGVDIGHPGGEEQVYVGGALESKGVVAVFSPAGVLEGLWSGAGTPDKSFTQNEEGEFVAQLRGVAVDGSGSFETSGDVYVATSGFSGFAASNLVDVFHPVAGGGGEPALVGQLTGTCPVPGTTCSGGEASGFVEPSGVAVSGLNGDVFVTDGRRVVDVFAPAGPGEYEFVRQLTGAPTGAGGSVQEFGEVASVAVDGGTGDVFVADASRGVVDEFDSTGEYVGRLTGTDAGSFENLRAVAVDPVSHLVYVGDFNEEKQRGSVDVFGGGAVVPDVVTNGASGVGVATEGDGEGGLRSAGVDAVFEGSVNPDDEGGASCGFVYGTSTAFGSRASCEPETVMDGASSVAVHGEVHGLAADTTYFYRLQASNQNGLNAGEDFQDQELVTPGPGVHGESASDVSSASATLQAGIDPNGTPTSYYFQYGKSAGSYEGRLPAAPGSFVGSGHGDVEVAPVHVQGLAASTVYHYRVVAVSALEVAGEVKSVAFPGADQTFTTQGAGSGLRLPDGREWEQVSPLDKHGALIEPIGETGGAQASVSGGSIGYLATVPTEEDTKGYVERVQVISTRTGSGWVSRDVSLAHHSAPALSGSYGPEYRLFSSDLSAAIVEPLGAYTSLGEEAFPPDTDRTPYVRHNSTCAAGPSTCFEPLVTGAAGFADVPEGTPFGGTPAPGPTLTHGEATFVGASPDLSHVILSSQVPLTSGVTGEREELYEWDAAKPATERLQLVSALPETGEPAGKAALLGTANEIIRDAVSVDGSRVVWSESGGHLYLRDTVKGESVQLDVMQAGGDEGNAGPRFQAASGDGSRVFFTDAQRLTADSRALSGRPDLYVCEMVETGGVLGCDLTDLTPGAGEEAANVQGAVLGASTDGDWVYYVADGALAEGAARGSCEGSASAPGARCNLYASHFAGGVWGPPRLVAGVSGDDWPDWIGDGFDLGKMTARVSDDGSWMAFMSDLGLTGYDTRDAVSGQPDEEVYLYDAAAGRLLCASCNPTGARPKGVPYSQLNDKLAGGDRVWPDGQWIAANLPAWTEYQHTKALYQPRYLADGGRLFFNSHDGLVAQDGNGGEDVYEFEPAGAGDCSSDMSGFSAGTNGCIGLISSGAAAGESAFMDASKSGDDVFFLTSGRLASGDVDTAIDLYDAHVCSAAAACLPSSTSPPACSTADSCRAAPSLQPAIFGAPSSATFSGAGNLPVPVAAATKPKTRPVACRKGFVKKHGRCLKQPKAKKPKAKRKRARKAGNHRRVG